MDSAVQGPMGHAAILHRAEGVGLKVVHSLFSMSTNIAWMHGSLVLQEEVVGIFFCGLGFIKKHKIPEMCYEYGSLLGQQPTTYW